MFDPRDDHEAGAAVSECSHELYVSVFRAVREAMAGGDAQELRALTSDAMSRTGVANLVSVLALIEARRGLPERSKAEVCGGVLCANKCADAVLAAPLPRAHGK